MKKRLLDVLEPAAHVALIGGAIVAAWIYWSGTTPDSNPPSEPTSVYIDSSEALSTWHPSERRIFLFVSPTCPFCNRSMDFYAQLAPVVDSLQRSGVPVALGAVIDSTKSRWLQERRLRSSEVDVDTLLSLSSLNAIGVSEVPTVALQSSRETPPSTWVGLQDSTGEQEILSAVRALGVSP